MPARFDADLVTRLHREVGDLKRDALSLEAASAATLEAIPVEHRESGRNLLHYLALRRHDIRQLQIELSHLGLSSLGRLEAHVMAGLSSVSATLSRLAPSRLPTSPPAAPENFQDGDARLRNNALALFGPQQREYAVRVMVTLPSAAGTDYELVRELVRAGMDVARINTAHDDEATWAAMVVNIRKAAQDVGRSCRILVDLAGPKLRTGTLAPGPRVLRVAVSRDERGQVTRPTTVALVPNRAPAPSEGEPTLPVASLLLSEAQPGDFLTFTDLAGRSRELRLVEVSLHGARAVAYQGFYLEPGMPLELQRNGKTIAMGVVGDIPARVASILLQQGEMLVLTGPDVPGEGAVQNEGVRTPAHVPCSLPEVMADVVPGERIFFDDGKIAGIVRQASATQLGIEILRTRPGGGKLGPDKGINLPDTRINLPALTEEDKSALPFVIQHADIVGMSFVRGADDILALHEELARRHAGHLGIVLKIETKQGFENLPEILLTGLRRPPIGVMVARGDLGVELGFERMAEVQEQILWLCEAAHVPVVWATQVLETLNKKGMPTRGEVTDAAMSARAECVMLNKGPHVVKTVQFLGDILLRMQDHHHKKTAMLRKLKVSEGRWSHENG